MWVRRASVVAIAALITATGACALEETDSGARDELADFADESSEALDGQPYDLYVRIAEQNGIRFLEFREAEQLAVSLCSGGSLDDDPGTWSPHDTAMVRAYCPELELGG